MKKSLFLFLMMLLPIIASADAVEIGGVYYYLVLKVKVASVTQNPNSYKGAVDIPETVTYNDVTYNVISILDRAFDNSGLTSVTIPNSVTSIGDYAFYGCSGLSSVTIPNSLTSIGDYTFKFCIGLTSVSIPNSVTSIGESALACCPELTDVYCYAENMPTTASDAFNDSYIGYATLHVPASAIESYRTTAPWSSFKSIVATDGSEPPTPEIKKCARPTIAYVNGKLKFTCETEGAEFVSEVIVADAKKYYDAEVSLLGVYHVTTYAMKTGYDNSDVASADFVIKGSTVTLVGDVNNDGKVDATDITKLIDILLKR